MIEDNALVDSTRERVDTRIVSPQVLEEDLGSDQLRPLRFQEFIGQASLRSRLEIFIKAANLRRESLDHVLLSGPPGLGKTTFAKIISNELSSGFVVTSGPAIERQGDLAAILTNLAPRDVLFIDEIHRLKLPVEEILYAAMEDYKLDIIVGKGPDARTLRIDLPPFTLVGATTKSGLLSAPLRDRFGISGVFEFYESEELAQVLRRSAQILKIKLDRDASVELASRSRGTPRIANRLLRRVRDVIQVAGKDSIDSDSALESLNTLLINERGLEPLDLKILQVLADSGEDRAVGLSTLAISVGEDDETISEVCEPYLIQLGFVERTPQGRKITLRGAHYYSEWKDRP
jgi:holliday junction DNA helicase RuvB